MKKAEKVINGICESATYEKMYGISKGFPDPGEFLIPCSWRMQKNLNRLGYVCQIRTRCGQFGSDMYFIRYYDGSLGTFENESFLPITKNKEVMAREIFSILPEDEQIGENEYRDCHGVGEVGFIIENSKSQPYPDTSFSITVTTTINL